MKHNNIFGDFIRRTAVLLSALFVITATAWAQTEPRVGIELCEAGPDYIHVKGWAVDPDYKDYSIDVAVSIYTDQNCTQSSGSSVYNANKETPDVSVIQSIPGKHGFEFNFPIDAGNYWLKFVVNNKNNTNSTILGPYPVTVTAPLTGTVTLTPQSGIITLGNGATLTGTGGENTYVTIAAGATVTFSDVNIANYNRHEEGELPSFIKCQGDATIILAKGTTNTIIGGQYLTPGIQVGPQNTTLTIKGYGTLVLRSWGWGSCIGARPKQACGNIVIEGGTFDLCTEIKYQEQHLSAYAACIGSSGNGSSCGDITISGGNITAWSSFGAAAIGSGRGGTCGNITITGGTIYAQSEYSLGGSAIGGGLNGGCGDISISGVTSVTAQIDPYTYPYCIGPGGGSGTCGTLTLWGQISDYIVGKLLVDIKLAPTDVPYTVSFNANGGTGSMSDQSFYSNTPQALTANGFSYPDKIFKCWSTKADGSGYDYNNEEVVTNLGDVTLYAQWANPDFVVHFDANGGFGTMAGQNFLWDMTQVLNANTFIYPGYAFVEWNTMQDGSGTSYTDKQAVSNLGNVTLYAQWTPTTYTITYVDAVNGTDNVTNTNPTNYAYMDNAITLAEPTRLGFVFDGWTYEGQDTPTKSVIIAQGTYGDLTFTAHWRPGTITLTTEFGSYTLIDGHTLTGTGGPETHISIAEGATVTLSDVIINDITDDMHHLWSGITCEGDATIILADGTINNLKGGYWSFPGISVPENKTLTIQGNGTLYSSSNGHGPGIGTDGYSSGDGNIIIKGGTIIATGSKKNPGIGGIYRSYSGNITITDGVTSVTATAGAEAPYSIGSGRGTVTIGGVVTDNIPQGTFTYNPSDRTPYTVTFDANGGEGSMDVQEFVSNTPKALTANVFTRTNHVFDGWNTKADGTGTNYSDGQTVINLGNVTLYARWWSTDVTRITTDTKEIELVDGDKIGGTGGNKTHVTIADGAMVKLCGVDITQITNGSSYQWAGITCLGDATIILEDGTTNAVTGGYHSAGITVPEGHTLTIKGNGSLTATGASSAAGIGSGKEGTCGNIIIEGGTITATGAAYAAGIGSGRNGTCGNIVIKGGTITATGEHSAGIGSGEEGSCGNIVIEGGTITATGDYSAGIGSGHYATCGNITIEGGNITANVGDSSAAAIGCGVGIKGKESSCGDITITNGVTCVIATKKSSPSIIGTSGSSSTCGTITVGDGLTDKTVDKTRYITVPDWTSTTSVTLAKEGYGTYYGLFDLVLPAGMKAYIVTTSADDGKLTYETIANGNTTNNIVPALTAVMLQTAAADGVQAFDVGITVPTVAAINQTNLLHGSEREKNTTGAGTGGKYYKLSYNTSGEDIGWYWGAEDGATFRSAANKAWLALPATAAAREFFGLPEEEETTSLSEELRVKSEESDNVIYNLAGQKLSRPQKGINIVNGKKILF